MNDLRRTFHAVARLARNVALDLRYGGFLGGRVSNDRPGYYSVVNTDYAVMEQLFAGRIRDGDVLLDVGCGKGRVLNWWLRHHGSHRIIGVEVLADVAAKTRKRLRRYPNVSIVVGDATESLPGDGTFFFISNPFNEALLLRLKEQLRALCLERPECRILYYAPTQVHVFADDPEWQVAMHQIRPPPAGHFEPRHLRFAEITWQAQ